MAAEELTRFTIAELAPRLQRREVSPVEVTQAHLERIARENDRLRAYLTVLPERALAAARRAEAEIARGQYRGPLHGIPVAVKDLFAIRGVRMTCGSQILAQHVAQQQATVVQRLEDAGAVLLGTLNLHEFAWGATSINPHYGTPCNPWDPTRLPGGSSGGSAVATRAGLAMATLGTDTGGSVRIPAALCGVVGLKPTYGRVSRHGVFPLCWSLDHPGPLTRSVTDAALVLQAIAGHDPADPTTRRLPVPDYAGALRGEVRGLRLGVPRPFFFEQLDEQVARAVEAALAVLRELGVTCVDLDLPLMRDVPGASLAIMVTEAYAVHEAWLRTRPQDYGADVRLRLALGSTVLGAHYLKAQRFRALLCQEVGEALRRVDALATPTTLLPAPRLDEPVVRLGGSEVVVAANLARFTRPFNLTGLPALSLPCGFSNEGLPIGLQLAGRPFDEATILRLAYAYEQHTSWHRRWPATALGSRGGAA
ncbi:MAG: glutamyl-tRNA(Gln) amidotransferase subunit A [Candidatus Tectimicrobiota bacterium]|nr:MAG: glutamyl-tRNA(Gln) amidotransferase subunit A [Candidatus Tectomicrobia bacterium]